MGSRFAIRAMMLAVLGSVVWTNAATARSDVSASRACSAPGDVYTAYDLRTKATGCRTAQRVVRAWNRHSGDCATGTDYGSAQRNTCTVVASGVRFFCSTHYAYAQVSKTTCTAGRRVVKFRYDPS
jgi:hypothetical protein